MDVHPAEIVIAIQIVQSAAALVLAGLLLYFFNTFRHAFLHHWACSSLALAMYLGASAAALWLYWQGPGYEFPRFLCSGVSLAAAYPHVIWLMIGTWEALHQRTVSRRFELSLVGAAALFGILSAAIGAFDPQAAHLRSLLRVELRYLLTGLAFLTAGMLLWRAQRSAPTVGARLAALGFCLFGLQMFHVVGLNLAQDAGYAPPFYLSYVGLVDFLFQSVIALGIVVWLLEMQQQRTRRAHSQLEHVRLHDPTTGLPNREMLIDQIGAMIDRTGERRIAVVSLGMNRFAMLNQALGWQRTEQIMRDVSLRVHEAISHRCALGRVSDRDLVIVRPTLDDPDKICAWTESLLASAIRPVKLEEQEIFATFCAGICIYPDDAREPEVLLQHSQNALVQSAQIGRDVTHYQQLEARAHREVEAALRFESELRRGLSEGQFELYYQPIVEVSGARVARFEALLRWRHPERGVLCPAAFLDQAATIGVLDALESFALASALDQLSEWNRRGKPLLKVAVNVSARRFQHQDLVAEVVDACNRFGVAPDRLDLEITENTALRDLPHAACQINALHKVGVKVALEVVAEGVESPAQLEFLAAHGCDLAQGFLLQRPDVPKACRFELGNL